MATSESGQSISRIVQGKVWSVNDPPYANTGMSIRIPEDSVVDLDPAGHIFDPDGRVVSVESEPGKISIELAGTRLRVKAAKDWHGEAQVGVKIIDDSGAVGRFSIPVIVAPVNDAPVLSGMPPGAAIQANGVLTVDFAGLVSDVDDSSTPSW